MFYALTFSRFENNEIRIGFEYQGVWGMVDEVEVRMLGGGDTYTTYESLQGGGAQNQ